MPAPVINYPFCAVVGQTLFKLALILSAVNPAIGGVLVSGPRGAAKSTLARGLADILAELDVLDGSGQNTSPEQAHSFVTLPLGTSEEMLVGTLDLQQILSDKTLNFQPGLLHRADGGVLYVDEVNLLQDNLVDLLLDVCASGINVVERDGVSHRHTARFILLGTMNPDEGELRPQLQDRFGLSVELDNQYSIAERVEIVRLRETFDASPVDFLAQYQNLQQELSGRISGARARLSAVDCSEELRRCIAERCHSAQVDGLRADIIWYRAAIAHAAFDGRDEVTEDDIAAVEPLVLAHRRNHRDESPPQAPRPPSDSSFSRPPASEQTASQSADSDWGQMEPEQLKTIDLPKVGISSKKTIKKFSARGATTLFSRRKGELAAGSSTRGQRAGNKVNWFTSLIASAGQWPPDKLCFRNRQSGQPVLHLVLLDTSASTLQQQLFAKAKGFVLQIADRAYLAKEQVTVLGFGNEKISTLLAKKRAPKSLRRLLDNIPAAGGTPMREMLQLALAYQQRQRRENTALEIRTYLITDGRTRQVFEDLHLLGDVVVIDIEDSPVKRGRAQQIAKALMAEYLVLPNFAFEA